MFGLGVGVATVAPTYFFSPIGGWKSDVIVHDDYFSRMAMGLQVYYSERVLENLKAATPFYRISKTRPFPPAEHSNEVAFFAYGQGLSE